LQTIFGGLPGDTALRPERVREALRQARQLPGLSVSASTEPDKTRNGSFVLKLETEFKPIEGSIKLSNRGTEEIGRNLLLAGMAANGLFGLENTSGIFVATAKDSDVYRSVGAHSNGNWGEQGANVQIQGSRTSVNIETDGIRLEQRRDLYLLNMNRPLKRRSTIDATLWGVFEVDNLDIIQDGTATREDRLRSVEVGITTTRRKNSALTQLKFGVERSIWGFGSDLGNLSGFTIAQLHYLATTKLGESSPRCVTPGCRCPGRVRSARTPR
jgi:hemolysin activation/secretion protein